MTFSLFLKIPVILSPYLCVDGGFQGVKGTPLLGRPSFTIESLVVLGFDFSFFTCFNLV